MELALFNLEGSRVNLAISYNTNNTSSDLNLAIYDIYGRLIKEINIEKQLRNSFTLEITTKEFKQGLYFCYLRTENANIVNAFVVY